MKSILQKLKFLHMYILLLCLVSAFFDEDPLGIPRKHKSDRSVGDRYEAIGEMQEEHRLSPGWFDKFDKEHPISERWNNAPKPKRRVKRQRSHRHRSSRVPRSRPSYRDRSHRARRHDDDFDLDSERDDRRREETRSRRYRSDQRSYAPRRERSVSRDHYRHNDDRDNAGNRLHEHHRSRSPHHSERDNAGNSHNLKSRSVEEETSFHATHAKRRQVPRHKTQTEVHWIPNAFAQSRLQNQPENTCDCSKCSSASLQSPISSGGDQPEEAAASLEFSSRAQPAELSHTHQVSPLPVPVSDSSPQQGSSWPQQAAASRDMHIKRRRELLKTISLEDADVLEFGSRIHEEEQQVSAGDCPDCCKEKQNGWAKPEMSIGLHIEEP